MNNLNERKLASRAKELGESASADALPKLAELVKSESPLVRRVAASAIGKLAGIVDSIASVDLLHPLLRDVHPQVRQYSAKALGAFGASSKECLKDFDDLNNSPVEKDYVKRSVNASIRIITEAIRLEVAGSKKKCQKCGVLIDANEYARSQKAFQRNYCDHCFDEVYLQRRNWETKVELNKNIEAKDGCLVQSKGEKDIAEWLAKNNIRYKYDERFRILDGYAIRPDFYLPEFDIYIEYWGMDTNDYKIGMFKKQNIYKQQGKRLLSLYPEDRKNLDFIIREKLGRYINL
jgi:disulfide oxidoreductase YuzD